MSSHVSSVTHDLGDDTDVNTRLKVTYEIHQENVFVLVNLYKTKHIFKL